MSRPEPPRSSMSSGMEWASRITTIGLMFALPALAGVGIDRWLGTAPVGVLAGAVLGFSVGMYQLLKISGQASRPS